MSEAKNKMSLTERIRNRIGDSALYGGKTICDSPQNGLTTNNKKSSLRAASEDKGTTNSHKEIFEFAALAHKKNRIGRCLTSLRSGHDILCNTLCGALRAQHDNAWKIITTTKIMNITFNGGYNA